MKIVILDAYSTNPGDLSWDALAELGELTVYDRVDPAKAVETIGDADIVFTNKCPITAETIEACPNIRFIGVLATGFNIVDIAAAKAHGIPVCNVPGYSGPSVAQLAIAFLLEIAHNIGAHSAAVKDGAWVQCADFCFWNYPLLELDGKTLGIIGYGNIGQRVGAIAQSMGMKILAYSRHPHPELENENVRYASLDEVLACSDFITLHCPQNDESVNLIRAETIAKMKDGAVVINTARGGCVVEQDIADALRSGKLAWYAADVVSKEPMQADNPLLTAPHCFITPHLAWASIESRKRLIDITVSNLKAFADGKPVNVVNA